MAASSLPCSVSLSVQVGREQAQSTAHNQEPGIVNAERPRDAGRQVAQLVGNPAHAEPIPRQPM